MKTNILSFALLSLFVVSAVISASPVRAATTNTDQDPATLKYSGLVQCDGVIVNEEPYRQTRCDFVAFFNEFKFLVNWMFYLAIPTMILLLVWAGYLYLTGVSGNIDTAKKIFSTAGIGFGLMCLAWFFIYTILTYLTKDSGFTTLLK
jgi:Type IV secretion system pilin